MIGLHMNNQAVFILSLYRSAINILEKDFKQGRTDEQDRTCHLMLCAMKLGMEIMLDIVVPQHREVIKRFEARCQKDIDSSATELLAMIRAQKLLVCNQSKNIN